MNLYKKCTAKPYYFVAFDATISPNNPLYFRKNLLQLSYHNREAAKISALSTGKIEKYEYLKGEEILPFSQRQNSRSYSSIFLFRNNFEKQTEKQVDAIKSLGSFNETEIVKS